MNGYRIPYTIPFNFDDAAQNTQYSLERLVPYNCAVYAISIAASRNITTSFYAFTLEFINYNTGERLMDEPIQNLNIVSDCRLLFRLPSLWFIQKNEKIICNINVLADSNTTDYFINLLSYVTVEHPNPGRAPFIYGLPRTVGFQDNVTSGGGPTSVAFGVVPTGAIAKNVMYDYEIHALTLDVSGDAGLSSTPNFSFQLSADRDTKKFFNRPVLNALAGGGTLFGQGATITGFPNNQVVQYRLPRPYRLRRHAELRFDVFPAPTYETSTRIHSVFNEQCCLAVIGTHIYE